MTRLTAAQARRVAVAAQEVGARPAGPVTRASLRRLSSRIQVLQLDSVSVAVRAHYAPVFSRLGPYDRDLLDRAAWSHSPRAPRLLVEYWAHEAALMPVQDWPLMRWRMREYVHGRWGVEIVKRNPRLVDAVIGAVTELGPATAGQIEAHLQHGTRRGKGAWGSGAWWNRSETKWVAEALFASGVLTTAHRTGFARHYDPAQRVLPADLFGWAAREVGRDVEVSSISGGTDVVTAFAGGTTGVPTVAGELSTRYLGVALQSWSPRREPLTGEVGEMVITAPMPSMPIGFWDDSDGSRYRAAYFDHHWADGPAPGVWRHGDWVTVTDRGSLIIHGRSDATLNRHGIRMGSADIYEVVEAVDAVTEAFVLGVDGPDGAYWMPLFVTLVDGRQLDAGLIATIRTRIRTALSPRHVPDEIIAAPGIPHTRTGKKLEVPVTAIMAGHTDVSLDPRSIDRPDLIDWYRDQGLRHRWTTG